MKKTTVYVLALVAVVLAVMNVAIWQKEKILDTGETVYLALAPADPRSLMQGDYMQLRYEVDNQYPRDAQADFGNAKKVVVKLDQHNIAQFVRLDKGEPLAEGEKRFRLDRSRYWPRIKPNTFFFQEGHASYYEAAKYGIFTFAKGSSDSYLLTGLADEKQQKIQPPLD